MFFFSANNILYTIEKDGSLYGISPSNGSWSRIGTSGSWIGTMTAVTMNGRLYSIEKNGKLYETNLSNGSWKQIGGAEFGNTKFMMAANGHLYTIENSGSLYEINVN
jgi:hypothetical protein